MEKAEEQAGYSSGEPGASMDFLLRPFLFVVVLWVIFWLDQRQMLDLYRWGVLPRQPQGLLGVLLAPFIHGSLFHLSNNSLPLIALGAGLYYFYPSIAHRVVIITWLASGLGVWIFGRESYHIGASGIIYALAAFIFLSGILSRHPRLMALSLLVVFLYGSMVWGVLPLREGVSWEAHLAGGLSGLLLAWYYRNLVPRRKRYSWDEDQEEQEEAPVEPPGIESGEKEIWEDYAHSLHGIRYIYKEQNKKKEKRDDTRGRDDDTVSQK